MRLILGEQLSISREEKASFYVLLAQVCTLSGNILLHIFYLILRNL